MDLPPDAQFGLVFLYCIAYKYLSVNDLFAKWYKKHQNALAAGLARTIRTRRWLGS